MRTALNLLLKAKLQTIKNYFKLRIYEIMFSVYGNFVVRNGQFAFTAGAN